MSSSEDFIDKSDFDIDNYNIEELINIIGLGSEIPLTNEKIVSTVEKYKQQFQDNESLSEAEIQHFIDFFDKIREKLLISKKEETIRDLYDEEIKAGGMTRKANVFQNRDARQATLLENNVIGDERIVGLEAANPAPFDFVALDTKNPLLRNTVKQLVNVSSRDRAILPEDSITCLDGSTIPSNLPGRLENSTDFTVHLNPPLKNVMEIAFESATIPHSWWTFSKDYGTNYFTFDKETIDSSGNKIYENTRKLEITEGNYKNVTLTSNVSILKELNEKCVGSGYDIEFIFNEIQEKMSVKNTSTTETIRINWYSQDVPQCSKTGSGSKVDYNLGWLLGFRTRSIVLEPNETKVAESVIDLVGTKYVFITLDDFNNNKPNQDIVSTSNVQENFTMPSYYVKTTMKPGENCNVTPDPPRNVCGRKIANPDLLSNLTSAQRYTINQIRTAMAGRKADRYSSTIIADVFKKVVLNIPPTGRSVLNTTNTVNVTHDYTKRIFFGPITLKKMRIRLLNDKGIQLNLNGQDWSFSFIVTKIYQN